MGGSGSGRGHRAKDRQVGRTRALMGWLAGGRGFIGLQKQKVVDDEVAAEAAARSVHDPGCVVTPARYTCTHVSVDLMSVWLLVCVCMFFYNFVFCVIYVFVICACFFFWNGVKYMEKKREERTRGFSVMRICEEDLANEVCTVPGRFN